MTNRIAILSFLMIFSLSCTAAQGGKQRYEECVTDPSKMNFQEMNNLNYNQGSLSEVQSIYKRLLNDRDFIGLRSGNSVYFMFDARSENMSSSPIISYVCEGLYCLKKDFYRALNLCTQKIGSLCQPLAATSGTQNFCFLSPEMGTAIGKEFKPFYEGKN